MEAPGLKLLPQLAVPSCGVVWVETWYVQADHQRQKDLKDEERRGQIQDHGV